VFDNHGLAVATIRDTTLAQNDYCREFDKSFQNIPLGLLLPFLAILVLQKVMIGIYFS